MERLLTVNETLEGMVERLKAAVKRPVYTVAPCAYHSGGDSKYRVPGQTGYREMGHLEVYLSGLTGNDLCTGREDMTEQDKARFRGDPPRDWRLFDLRSPDRYQLVFPITPDDSTMWGEFKVPYSHDFFKAAGLRANINDVDMIFPTALDKIPEELVPYVREYRRNHGNAKARGIRFARSEAIVAPLHCRRAWHLGTTTGRFTSLQPPGRYSNDSFANLTDFNRFGVVDQDPGPCVCCQGASGERKHVVTIVGGGDGGAWPSNHVCRACSKQMFAEIQGILDGDK